MKTWIPVHDCHPNEPNLYPHLFATVSLLQRERHTVRTQTEREWEREAVFPPSLSPPWFSLSVCHSYLWEIRLETVTEKRGGDKSGRRVATHVPIATLYIFSLLISLILHLLFFLPFLPCSSTLQLLITLNFLSLFIFNLSLDTSLCSLFLLDLWPVFLFHSHSPSLPLRA